MNKKILFIMGISMLVCFASCDKAVLEEGTEGTTTETGNTGTKQMVALNVKALKAPMEGASEVRAPKHQEVIYGVNVYEKKGGAASYTKYAYGLFTDPSKIKLEMYQDRKYKIECLAIQEDKDTLYQTDKAYNLPYTHGEAKTATLATNAFVMSSSENLDQITNGTTTIGKGITESEPRMIKYYGMMEDYDPTSQEAPSLTVKKVSYGIHFLITAPSEGTINVKFGNRNISLKAGKANVDETCYYAFEDILAAYNADYTLSLPMTLTWTKANGDIFTSEKAITLAPNKLINLSIDVSNPDPKAFTITLDGTEMTQESIEWHYKVS